MAHNAWFHGRQMSTPESTFIFSKCKICKRLHAIVDGKNYNYLDGCFHDSHTQHYKMEAHPKVFKIK